MRHPVGLDEFVRRVAGESASTTEGVATQQAQPARPRRAKLTKQAVLRVLEETGWTWLIEGDRILPAWALMDGVRVRLALGPEEVQSLQLNLERIVPYLMALPPDDSGEPVEVRFQTGTGQAMVPQVYEGPSFRTALKLAARQGGPEGAQLAQLVEWIARAAAASEEAAAIVDEQARLWDEELRYLSYLPLDPLFGQAKVSGRGRRVGGRERGAGPGVGDGVILTLRPLQGTVVVEYEPASRRRPESLLYDGEWLDALAEYVGREPVDAFGRALVRILPQMPWARQYPAGDLWGLAERDPRVVALQGHVSPYGHTIVQPRLCRVVAALEDTWLVRVSGLAGRLRSGGGAR